MESGEGGRSPRGRDDGDATRATDGTSPWSVSVAVGGWPRVDTYADGLRITMEVELPGVRADQVQVALESDRLSIEGPDRRVRGRPARFHRTIRLPHRVDPASVHAELVDGLLTITADRAAAGRRRLSIAVRG